MRFKFSRSAVPHILTFAPKVVVAFGGMLIAAGAMATVVTPGSLQGWALGDGSSGTSPASITGTQAYNGNGSIQFTINASNQQPLAYYSFGATAIRFGDLLGSNMSFGYSYLLPTGSPPATSPTIRLLLGGLGNSAQSGGRTDGSLGFYVNGAGDDTWHTQSLSMTSGDFFFRIGGKAQEAVGCGSGDYAQSFDDRRQTLAAWASKCVGTATNTVDLDDAFVTGIEVDFGTIPGVAGSMSVFADAISFNIGRNVGDFNFEVSATAVPEPGSLALLGLGLAGLVAIRKRKQA